jgi:hypothetical protein
LVLYVFGSLGFENFTAQISLRDKEQRKYIGTKTGKKQKMQLSTLQTKVNTVIEYGKLLSMVQVRFHGKRCLGKTMAMEQFRWITTYQNVLI